MVSACLDMVSVSLAMVSACFVIVVSCFVIVFFIALFSFSNCCIALASVADCTQRVLLFLRLFIMA